jgi:hypothetical protein
MMFPRDMAPELEDHTITTCRRGGFPPTRVDHASRLSEVLFVDDTVFLVPQQAAAHTPGLVWRPLSGEPLVWQTSVAWRRGATTQTIRTSADAVRRAFTTFDDWREQIDDT